jgi:hypothetical protein
MKLSLSRSSAARCLSVAICLFLFSVGTQAAVTTSFFANSPINSFSRGTITDTISSGGYLFTYSSDNLMPGGLGRTLAVALPNGLEAQSIEYPPPGTLVGIPASITITRVDGGVFDLTSFTGEILANTAATGASFEIMPQLNGNDGFANPLALNASGYSFNSFSYNASYSYGGSTATLTGFDSYTITLNTDFALTQLTLSTVPEPSGYAFLGLGLIFLAYGYQRQAKKKYRLL